MLTNKILPQEIAKLEEALDGSSLDAETRRTIKGLVVGQTLLIDLIEQLVASSGHQRTKIIKELIKILELDSKEKKKSPMTMLLLKLVASKQN
jgi:hypothetical protein